MKTHNVDVLVVGAGAAGMGLGSIFKKLGMDFIIVEKHRVGASFLMWPQETCFITPSFTGNFFRAPDLNAVTPGTSPAFTLHTEHPSGVNYAEYLQLVSDHYELPVHENTNVTSLVKEGDEFVAHCGDVQYRAKYVVWAAGEYQYPKLDGFVGADLCIHSSRIPAYSDLSGDEYIIIGGYESGFDAAISLAMEGKKPVLIGQRDYLEYINSDSSYSLSPYTRDLFETVRRDVAYHANMTVREVQKHADGYTVICVDGSSFHSANPPINATGFAGSLTLISEMLLFTEGYPQLNEFDESTLTSGLYVSGPKVKHDNALFCFIYKFRQRFAVIAEHIGWQLGLDRSEIDQVLAEYKENNFYLADLSCCGDECVC